MDAPNVRRRAVSLVIILVLYFIFDSTPTPQASSRAIDRAVTEETAAWQVLNSSRFGDFDPVAGKWLNLTGFSNDRAWSWQNLPQVHTKAREFVTHAIGAEHSRHVINGDIPELGSLQFYRNVTGEVKGAWRRSSLSTIVGSEQKDVNGTRSLNRSQHLHHHNITGDAGTLQIGFKESGLPDDFDGLNVRGLRARFIMYDNAAADSFSMVLTGMHILEAGSIILVTHSANFPALFGLPHLALSERHFLASQHRLNRTLKDVIELQSSHQLKSAAPWSPSMESLERQSCDVVVYLQQYPVKSQYDVETLESELRIPQGRPRLEARNMHMNMVMLSPNCGYVIESTHGSEEPSLSAPMESHLSGMKLEAYNSRVKKHSLVFAVLLLLQALSIVRQTKDASTPSMKNRISVKTMLILNIADGLVALSFVPMIALTDNLFTTMAAVAFMAVICGVYFNLPFLAGIWTVQHEEAIRENRQQRANAPNTNQAAASAQQLPIITAAGADSLPLPVTAGPAIAAIGADGEILGMNPDDSREPRSVIQSRLAFAIVTLWIFSIWMTTTSPFIQQGYFFLLSIIYVSCWVPQIMRNAMRNCRKALRWDFVVCQSILRLIPLLYFYAYDKNLADNIVSSTKAVFLVGLFWLQLCVLVVQYVFGPRLLVPTTWLPPAYDYHPILKEDDESTRIILGYSTTPTSPVFKHTQTQSIGAEVKGSKSKRLFDCAICMQGVEVPIIPNASVVQASGQKLDNTIQNSFLWRRAYMITPCRHVFHTKCLEMAMRYRLQCPICREGLPPL